VTPSPVFLPLRELAGLVRTRRISPVALAEQFLERIETLGPRYNAVVTVTRERALREARRAEAEITAGGWRGPLHGIPYGAKDLLATAGGIPTTWGAAPLRGQTFDADATVIRRLESAGAVLVAKLAMVELAGGAGYRQPRASFTGPGRSPWSEDAWSGGSSSGSASAVAAGLVPFALGSETWGSIVSPAANCGVTGLRPTLGRVSRHGAMALSWSLDKIGPLGLTADDCGLVLEAIAGPDPLDPSAAARLFRHVAEDPPDRRFRFGVLRAAAEVADADVRARFEEALLVLRTIGTVEDVTLPALPYEAITRTILFAEAASALEGLVESGALAGLTAPEDRYTLYARDAILAKDYIKALRLRAVVAREIDRVLAGLDAIVTPGRFTVASRLDETFRSAFGGTVLDPAGAIGNAAGLPAVAVPDGFGERGLPTSLQFVGRAWGESAILAAARAYQDRTDWHRRHPPVG
jgi:Asp-tRNA(Asn)/Glu-tRNA(Gln) amidotransferase A subunit family amidase